MSNKISFEDKYNYLLEKLWNSDDYTKSEFFDIDPEFCSNMNHIDEIKNIDAQIEQNIIKGMN